MKIDPLLIQAIAGQVYGVRPDAGRAQDIAREVQGLLSGLEAVVPVDFLTEPDGFRAALWSLAQRSVMADDDER